MSRCKELFHPRNFLLSYLRPQDFVIFEWGYPTVYLIWRSVWALYHLIWIVLTGVYSYEWTTSKANEITWFIYLTHWAYLVLTVSTLMELAAVIHVKCSRPDILSGECKYMPVFMKAVWVMFNIANTASMVITILFWGLLYTPSYKLTTADVPTHAINTLYVLINLMVTAVPVRFYHFFHSVIFSAIYVIFSVIYQEAGGRNGLDKPYIYSVLDWSQPGTAALYAVLVTLVLTPICHFVVFALYLLRQAIFNACLKRDSTSDVGMYERKR